MYFIDTLVNMLLFTTILNITVSKRAKTVYVLAMGSIAFLSRTFISDPFGSFLNILIGFFLIKFILHSSWLKALLSEFITITVSIILELFLQKICLDLLQISYDSIMYVPIFRLILSLTIYLFIYLLYRTIKYFKF